MDSAEGRGEGTFCGVEIHGVSPLAIPWAAQGGVEAGPLCMWQREL